MMRINMTRLFLKVSLSLLWSQGLAALLFSNSGVLFRNRGTAFRHVSPQLAASSVGEAADENNLPAFTNSDVVLERFLGEQTYSIVESFRRGTEVDGGTADGLSGLGKTPQLTSEGKSTVRVWRGRRTDVSIRSRGEDPRCVVKEYASSSASSRRGSRDAAQISAREEEVHVRLLAEWNKPGGRGVTDSPAKGLGAFFSTFGARPFAAQPPPFPLLLGTLTDAMAAVVDGGTLDEDQWRDALGEACEPPRPRARWLVFGYDGTTTAESFAVPQAQRVARGQAARAAAGGGIGLPPAPKRVTNADAARFLLDAKAGVFVRSLAALALVHEAGLAHRSISSGGSLLLTAEAQDKGAALERLTPSLLRVKLTNFGFATPLSDGGSDRCESLARFGVDLGTAPSVDRNVALTRFAIAEDLGALGFVFLQLFLGALSGEDADYFSDDSGTTTPTRSAPAATIRDLERQVEEIFRGEDLKNGFRRYAAAEPQWTTAVAILDANAGEGWDFFQSMLGAREAAARQIKRTKGSISSLSFQTASAQKDHPFLKRWQ